MFFFYSDESVTSIEAVHEKKSSKECTVPENRKYETVETKEQNENMKTFFDLLGEAQMVIEEITQKLQDTPREAEEEGKQKTVSLKEQLLLKSISKIKPLLGVTEEVYSSNVGVQVSLYGSKDTVKAEVTAQPSVKQAIKSKIMSSQGNRECQSRIMFLNNTGQPTQVRSEEQLSSTKQVFLKKQSLIKPLLSVTGELGIQVNLYEEEEFLKQKVAPRAFEDKQTQVAEIICANKADETAYSHPPKLAGGYEQEEKVEPVVTNSQTNVFSTKSDVIPDNAALMLDPFSSGISNTSTEKNDNLDTISEKTEVSSNASKNKSECKVEALNDILCQQQSGNNDESGQTLKEMAAKVIVNTKVYGNRIGSLKKTAINEVGDSGTGKNIAHVKFNEQNESVDVRSCQEGKPIEVVSINVKSQCKKPEVSIKSKLSIQIMPSINIPRGLITQKIPTIVITSKESIPQLDHARDSNVGYQMVKHLSSEVNIKTTEEVKNDIDDMEICQCCIQTDSKEKPKVINIVQPVQQSSGATLSITKETLRNGNAAQGENIKTDVTFNIPDDTNEEVKQNDAERRTTNLDGSEFVTAFHNTQFKRESESEQVLAVADTDIETSNGDTTSISSKKSNKSYLSIKEGAKDFMNKMMQNPAAEVIFKSYQILQEQSGHDPDNKVHLSELSLIDNDVYKTFVNPDGLRTVEVKPNELVSKQPSLELPVVSQMPPEFYATKATQWEKIPESEKSATASSESSFKQKDDDTQTLLSFVNIDEPPYYLGMNEIMLQFQNNSRNSKLPILSPTQAPTREGSTSRVHLNATGTPRDSIQKKLAAAAANPRNSVSRNIRRRSSQPPAQNDIENTESADVESQMSVTTEDMIFAINKSALKLSPTQNLNELHNYTGAIPSTSKKYSISPTKTGSLISLTSVGQRSEFASEYVITHDTSMQTSSINMSHASDMPQHFEQKIDEPVESLKLIAAEDIQVEDDAKDTSCCAKLAPWKTKKNESKDAYKRSNVTQPAPQKTSLSRNSKPLDDLNFFVNIDPELTQRKSVKIEQPEISVNPISLNVSLPTKIRRKLSRKPVVSPVESFIKGLTNRNKNDIAIARNVPRNEMSVFEKSPEEIIHSIKAATDRWREEEKKSNRSINAEGSELRPTVNDRPNDVGTLQANKSSVKHDDEVDQTEVKNSNDPIEVMTVNVQQPEIFISKNFFVESEGTSKSCDVSVRQRNVPGGDDINGPENVETSSSCECEHKANGFYPTHLKYEGIFPRRCKYWHKQIKNETASSSEATTSKSISEKTEEVLSEGEVKCRCSASLGEIHVCPQGESIQLARYLKRHPQNLMKYEFGDPNLKICRQKQMYSNWVAYYVSRSPSPELDNTESLDDSTESSGLIKK